MAHTLPLPMARSLMFNSQVVLNANINEKLYYLHIKLK